MLADGGTFIIRRASSPDYEATCALNAEGDDLHRRNVPWLFRTPEGEPRSRELFETQVAGPDTAVFVADAGPTVGVALALMKTAPDIPIFVPQRWCVLDNLVVASSWRRRGVGTALVRAVEAWAHGRHARWVELGVYRFNEDARALYESLGYSDVLTKMRRPFSDEEER